MPHEKRENISIFGGDRDCMLKVARRWKNEPCEWLFERHITQNTPLYLFHHDLPFEIVFVLDSRIVMNNWQGLPLVWLFPERGPSDIELSEMQLFITNNTNNLKNGMSVLILIPGDSDRSSVEKDIDDISYTITTHIDFGGNLTLEGVYVSNPENDKLNAWLEKLVKDYVRKNKKK